MGKKFVFLHLSKSMDWLKSGLDWFKSVRESSLDSADDASDRRGSSGGGDSRLECNLDQIQSHLWPPSPPEKMEGNNYHQWRDASEKMGAVPLVCHTVTWCIPIEKLYLVDQI